MWRPAYNTFFKNIVPTIPIIMTVYNNDRQLAEGRKLDRQHIMHYFNLIFIIINK